MVRSLAKTLRSVAGFPCGALSRFSCTTGGRFAVKLGFLTGLQRCRYGSIHERHSSRCMGADWPAVSPRGERASSKAQPRALNQASYGVNALGLHRRGEMNRKHLSERAPDRCTRRKGSNYGPHYPTHRDHNHDEEGGNDSRSRDGVLSRKPSQKHSERVFADAQGEIRNRLGRWG